MIEKLITYLNAKLQLTGYFEKIYHLAEPIKKSDGKTLPKAYCGNGEFVEVSNFDFNYGQSYWRKNGKVSIEELSDAGSFQNSYKFTIPLKLVCFVPKDKISLDDAYSDDRIAQSLIKQMTTFNDSLRGVLSAKRASVIPGDYDTNKQSVLSGEYSGLDITNVSHKNSYISIDFRFEITLTKSCLETECDIDPDILHSFDFCKEGVRNKLTEQQLSCLTDALCNFVDPTVRNSDNSYNTTAPSVGLTLPDITVTQSDGSTETIPAVTDVICQQFANATVKNSDNSYIETVGNGEILLLPDITVTQPDGSTTSSPAVKNVTCNAFVPALVKNSVGSIKYTLSSGGIATIPKYTVKKSTGATLVQNEFDVDTTLSPVLVKNSVGATKYTLEAGDTQNIPKHNIYKSDGITLYGSDEFDQNRTIPAVTVNYGGTTTSYDGGESVTIPRIYAYPITTGSTTSYATRDDAWVQSNYFSGLSANGKLVRLTNVTTLAENNTFGNTNRFTDSLGAQLYGIGNAALANYIIDHYTGLGWYAIPLTGLNWSTAISTAAASTQHSFSDWFVPNYKQLDGLLRSVGGTSQLTLNYAPFSISNSNIWTSTTGTTTTNAIEFANGSFYQVVAKTQSKAIVLCRKHF